MVYQNKILHISLSLSGGGSEKQIFNLCMAQKNQGYDVHLIILKWCNNCKILSDKGIIIHFLNSYKYYQLKFLFQIINIQKKINPNISLSWMPTLDFPLFIASIINRKKFIINERASILTYQNFWIKNYKNKLLKTSITHNFIIFLIIKILRYLSLKFCNAIITNSIHMSNYYKNKFKKKLVYQINNMIIFDQNKDKIYLNDSFTFLIVSRLIELKNIEIVIDSFIKIKKNYKNIKLVIIGNGYHKKNIINIVPNEFKNDIDFFKELENWYFKFNPKKTFYIQSSFYEGQPNTVLEASFNNFPTILSNIPAHTDLFSEDSCLFFDPYSIKDLCKKMIFAINENEPSKIKRIINSKKNMKYHSQDYVCQRYTKIISLI